MSTNTPNDYERHIVQLMKDRDLTLLEALCFDFEQEGVDVSSVLSICDYLECALGNLDKVLYYMLIYTGQEPDLELKKI
jgi:hypothetical protein